MRDRETKEPAAAEALAVSERMKDAGVVVYPTGAYDNVLKIKPPMIFGHQHVDLFVRTLDQVLTEDPETARTDMTGRIDINADAGESFGRWVLGRDAELLPLVTTVNIACGFHAGDPSGMRAR